MAFTTVVGTLIMALSLLMLGRLLIQPRPWCAKVVAWATQLLLGLSLMSLTLVPDGKVRTGAIALLTLGVFVTVYAEWHFDRVSRS
jgi:hypothetical protein